MDPHRVIGVTAKIPSDEGWLGVESVSAHLRVAKKSICRWIDSKGFPAHRVGYLFGFKLSEVDEWVRRSGGDSDSAGPTEGKGKGAKTLGGKST